MFPARGGLARFQKVVMSQFHRKPVSWHFTNDWIHVRQPLIPRTSGKHWNCTKHREQTDI